MLTKQKSKILNEISKVCRLNKVNKLSLLINDMHFLTRSIVIFTILTYQKIS